MTDPTEATVAKLLRKSMGVPGATAFEPLLSAYAEHAFDPANPDDIPDAVDTAALTIMTQAIELTGSALDILEKAISMTYTAEYLIPLAGEHPEDKLLAILATRRAASLGAAAIRAGQMDAARQMMDEIMTSMEDEEAA